MQPIPGGHHTKLGYNHHSVPGCATFLWGQRTYVAASIPGRHQYIMRLGQNRELHVRMFKHPGYQPRRGREGEAR